MKIAHGIGSRILLSSFLVLLSCLGLWLVNVKRAFAEGSVGVSQGQFLHYSMDFWIVGGNDTVVMNQSQFHYLCNVTVKSVNGSLIQFVDLLYNASWKGEKLRVEDVTGKWAFDLVTGFEPFFVASNLSAGELLFAGPQTEGFPIIINETISTSFLGSSRETNHVILENKGWNTTINNVDVSCNTTYQIFFDKLTGASVYSTEDFLYYRENGSDLLVTNERWEYVVLSSDPPIFNPIPEFAPSLFLMFFCTASLLVVAISMKRHR